MVRVQENIKNIVRKTLEDYDCIEVMLPTLQPKQIWEESGRWEQYSNSNQMFICEMQNGTFCMAPTAEEAIFTFVRDNLKSYKDLPVNLFQIGSKYRNELRARGGLLRSKEFLMMDAYSFHSSDESLKEGYYQMREAYFSIFSKIGLNVIPVAAVNGDMGGKISEEFMFVSEAGEDTILFDENSNIGINTEILEMQNSTQYLKSNYGINDLDLFKKKHCIELGHIFQLGQRYSLTMNGKFMDQNNKLLPYYMGCYGIGIGRTLAAICEQNCDNDGLIWPKFIAPYQVSILYQKDRKAEAFNLYDLLKEVGISVIIDDRETTFGAKIKDFKLFGIPYMVIIGKKSQHDVYELEERKSGKKSYITLERLIDILK